jgi:hypothetical protein
MEERRGRWRRVESAGEAADGASMERGKRRKATEEREGSLRRRG